MQMGNFDDLDEELRDILSELGNIGTGNAVTSLAEMMGHSFEIKAPKLRFVKYQDIFQSMGIRDELQAGILVDVLGELRGMFLFLMDESFSRAVLEQMLEETAEDLTELTEMQVSLLWELGNIICGSYLRALSCLTGLETDVAVPDLCIDMAGAIMGVPLARHLKVSDNILMIENEFHMGNQSFVGRILFWPEADTLSAVVERLKG